MYRNTLKVMAKQCSRARALCWCAMIAENFANFYSSAGVPASLIPFKFYFVLMSFSLISLHDRPGIVSNLATLLFVQLDYFLLFPCSQLNIWLICDDYLHFRLTFNVQAVTEKVFTFYSCIYLIVYNGKSV